MEYDIFISHACEDKADVARPLTLRLRKLGLKVWLDEFELTVGDSLRRSIDRGLSQSKYGAVILSPAFFAKKSPNRELDGLVAREDGRDKVILPIWHNVDASQVLKYSPTLADKLAVCTSCGLEFVAERILEAVRRKVEPPPRPNGGIGSAPPDRKSALIKKLMIWFAALLVVMAAAGMTPSIVRFLKDWRNATPTLPSNPVPAPVKDQDLPEKTNGVKKPSAEKESREPAPETQVWKVEPVTIPWGAYKLKCVALTPDGQTVALGGESDTVELWDVRTGTQRASFPGHPGHVFSLAFAPGGKTLAVGSYKQIWLWDVDGREKHILEGHEAEVRWVGFVDNGKTLMSIGPDVLKVWDVDAKKEKKKGGVERLSKYHRLVLSGDGKYLAEIAAMPLYDYFQLWDVATAKTVRRLDVRFARDPFAFSPDSQALVGISGENVKVLDVPLLRERGHHGLHTQKVCSVAISRDGRTLASGSDDKTAILWDLAKKDKRATLGGHTGSVLVCFSPDGKMLATGSNADPFVKLWDVATGEARTELKGLRDGSDDIQFSPTGQTLAIKCRDQTAKFWSVVLFTATAK